jgi:23S rRNA pseudouridine1911/1915/1917 synthase
MTILFEDKWLLVINKPAGLLTESGDRPHPSAEKAGLDYLRAGPRGYLRAAHRLDRPTSGVLLLAKTKSALTHLMAQFEQRQTEKRYRAWVQGLPPVPQGQLTHWLYRDPTGKKALISAVEQPGSQLAELHYTLVQTNGPAALLEIHPKTGRYHQIRAQLAHIGCPVVGDVTYGGPAWQEAAIQLQACSLRFRHPNTAADLTITAPYPADWPELAH